MIKDNPNHLGTAKCLIGIMWGHGQHDFKLFEGSTRCLIVPPCGSNNFGWDSICQPLDSDKTFAEMTIKEKEKYSPRGEAFC